MLFFRPGRRLRALCYVRAETYGGGSAVGEGEEFVVAGFDFSDKWLKCRRITGTVVATGKASWEDFFLVSPDPKDFEILPPAWLAPIKNWWQGTKP